MSSKTLFVFCLIIFILKITAIYYTKFDLFGDEAQYWIWSLRPDLGYYSKPPLLVWLITFISFMFGDSFEVLKLIPVGMYVLTSIAVFLIFKQLYQDKRGAILAGLTFYFIPAATVSSFLISTDILLVFFWSLSLFFLLKIRSEPSVINFVLLGIFVGLSFLSKYAAVYFILSVALVLVVDLKLRKIFFTKFISVTIFLFSVVVIVLPNIVWNIQNNWLTLVHTSDNAALNRININLIQGLEFVFIQTLMLGPILFIYMFITYKKINLTFEAKFLLAFCIPVFLIVLIESILVRANANWAAVGLISLYIFIFHHTYMLSKNIIKLNVFVNFIFGVLLFSLIANTSSFSIFNRINGITSFASYLEKTHMTNKDILVVGDRLLFSNLKYLYKNLGITMFSPHAPYNKITSQTHLSFPLLPTFNQNFILIGRPEQLKYLENKFNILKVDSQKVIFKNTPIEIYEVIF